MSQSNVVFAFILAAFIVFVTMRGELPVYLAILTGKIVPADDPVSQAPEAKPTSGGAADSAPPRWGSINDSWSTQWQRSGQLLKDAAKLFGF